MAFTVFYSWQSDKPNKTNRNFIEDALNRAIKKVGQEISIQEALRDESIELDKDTKNIPGMPPIVDAIFEKISSCGIFVPDLTFVGKTKENRLLQNPNVLIEYGWALKEVTYSRIIPVMNIAFGEPSSETLPFDMRHLRRPLTYNLEENATSEERSKIKSLLADELAEAIKLIINKKLIQETKKEEYKEIPSTTKPSTFLKPGEKILDESNFHPKANQHILSGDQQLFLRIIPPAPGLCIKTSKEALDIAQSGGLRPLSGDPTGKSYGRNKYGAYACYLEEDSILHFTQLFKNGELWGIDAYSINKSRLMERANVDFGFFPSSYIEKIFYITLKNYLTFAKDVLKLKTPLKLIAGAAEVEGYRMAAPASMTFGGLGKFKGSVVEKNLIYESSVDSYDEDPAIVLKPFFEYIWEECGLDRPDKELL